MRTTLTEFTLLLGVLGVLGCGTATAPDEPMRRAEGGEEPTTPAALAWVAAQHAGDPDSASARR